MTDPLSLFPLALAAAGGQVDGLECRQLVTAGLTLLQRAAPLVRVLSGRRSAILLPAGPAFLVALAASDGRGALVLELTASPEDIAWQLADADVGAVFTTKDLASRLPSGLPLVLLDDAPRSAHLTIGDTHRDVDLGSHFGLELEGFRDAEGREEECIVVYEARTKRPVVFTHRRLLCHARGESDETLTTMSSQGPLGALTALAATLISGGSVTTRH